MSRCRFPRSTFFLCTFIVVASHLNTVFAASKRCFDQNGNELATSRALPCNPNSTQDGPCCAPGDICLSNGLCTPGPDLVNIGMTNTYKPSCTDGTWTVDTCFSGCNSFNGWGMKQCGDNRFCCFVDNSTIGCDCAQTSLFELDAATFVTTLPISSVLSTSSSPASASAITTSASKSTSMTPSSSHSPTSTPQSSSHSLAIGAGVGIGIGVPLLAAVGVLTWYLHRRQRAQEAAPHQGFHGDGEPKDPTKVAYAHVKPVNELSAEIRHEMDGLNVPHEVDGSAKYRNDA